MQHAFPERAWWMTSRPQGVLRGLEGKHNIVENVVGPLIVALAQVRGTRERLDDEAVGDECVHHEAVDVLFHGLAGHDDQLLRRVASRAVLDERAEGKDDGQQQRATRGELRPQAAQQLQGGVAAIEHVEACNGVEALVLALHLILLRAEGAISTAGQAPLHDAVALCGGDVIEERRHACGHAAVARADVQQAAGRPGLTAKMADELLGGQHVHRAPVENAVEGGPGHERAQDDAADGIERDAPARRRVGIAAPQECLGAAVDRVLDEEGLEGGGEQTRVQAEVVAEELFQRTGAAGRYLARSVEFELAV
eukprot:m.170559 g.170559  ORF g.170559 m.170559 type:complete len:310 (+) comp9929_c0_seq2:2589-3518(+)